MVVGLGWAGVSPRQSYTDVVSVALLGGKWTPVSLHFIGAKQTRDPRQHTYTRLKYFSADQRLGPVNRFILFYSSEIYYLQPSRCAMHTY